MSWTNLAKNLLYYFWGTHDNKYVVDHLGRKIVFFDFDYTNKNKQSTTYTNKSKS